jgi:hypothetical protein
MTTRINRLAEIVADADQQLARARVIRARLVELHQIALKHSLLSPEGLRRWDQASGQAQGGARKR